MFSAQKSAKTEPVSYTHLVISEKITTFANVNRLERHIEILLLSNDCVIVPGFGGFMVHLELWVKANSSQRWQKHAVSAIVTRIYMMSHEATKSLSLIHI